MTTPSASRRTIEEELGLQATKVELGLLDELQPIPVGEDERFLVHRALGRGSMGTVYLAEDLRLGREVALKVVAPRKIERSQLQKRLEREAQALAALRHDNVVQAFDLASTDAGELFIAMEYVPGDDLRAWLGAPGDGRRRSIDEVLDVFSCAARGLEAAHEAGIVHRDFKPDNVLVDESGKRRRVLVGDFGLAGAEPRAPGRGRLEAGTLTATRGVLGTLAYMAPEQLRGERAGARSDQHQFCVALWEAVAGERPFDDQGRSPEPGQALPPRPAAMPRWVHRVLVRGLAFEPARRHASMTRVIALLERGRRWRRWSPRIAATAALALVATGTAVLARPSPCEAADAALAEVWTPEVRHRLDTLLREPNQPYTPELAAFVVGTLDEAASDWAQRARAVCRARVEDPGPQRQLERREVCLERWAERFERRVALLGERGSDEDAAQNVHRLIAPLRDPGRQCQLPPVAIAASVQRAVERAEESALLGDLTGAHEGAERAIELAAAQGYACQPDGGRDSAGRPYSSELAAALLSLGMLQRESGSAQDSLSTLVQAHTHALACDDGHRFIDARIHAAKIEAVDLGQDDDAAQALQEARVQMLKLELPATDRRRYEHEKALGLLASRRQDYGQAREHYLRSMEALGELQQHPIDAAKLLHNVGTTYQHQERYPEADQAYARALETMRVLGAEHPAVSALAAKQALSRGQIAAEQGRYDQARGYFEHALATPSPRVATMAYISLAQSEYQADRMPAARRAGEAALALVEANPGLSPALVANAHGTTGQVLAELHDPRSLILLDRAQQLWAQQQAAQNVSITRFHRALALHRLGRNREARAALDSLRAEPEVPSALEGPMTQLAETLATQPSQTNPDSDPDSTPLP